MKHLLALLLAGVATGAPATPAAAASGRASIDLSGPGWTLWQDKAAAWENDELFLPPVELGKAPINAPTGGWGALNSKDALPVAVPGTAEEYLGKGNGPESAVKGVTWWVRTFEVPADATGKTIRLLFDSARQRAEVYVNQKLAGYDVVGNTPFEADLTGMVKPGEKVRLAVRITNPGGSYAWADVHPIQWGKYSIPMNHGFGGVTGGVHLAVTESVYIDDLYVQNTPAKTSVNVIVTVNNTTKAKTGGSALVSIKEKATGKVVFRRSGPFSPFRAGRDNGDLSHICP